MSDRAELIQLDYVRRPRRRSIWREPEVLAAVAINAFLVLLYAVGRAGVWPGGLGAGAAMFVVAAALQLTLTFVAGLGIFVARDETDFRTWNRPGPWPVFGVVAANLGLFVAGVAGAVAWHG